MSRRPMVPTIPIAILLMLMPTALYADILAVKAANGDTAAIRALREMGPAGLDRLLRYRDEVHPQTPAAANRENAIRDARWELLTAAIDAVAMQKDAHASGLYWYTDIEQAQAAAVELDRPILSLRLLGRLNEDLSCANSRFFRTTLYANEEVSRVLRERFVLHWESVRPVPVITIDFGDGRLIERTVTGNSIHYILDADGRPIEAIPGLYGPAAFLRALGQAERLASQLNAASGAERDQLLRQHHAGRLVEITRAWKDDLRWIGQPVPQIPAAAGPAMPHAHAADAAVDEWERLRKMTHEPMWAQIARLHSEDAQLDTASIRLIRGKQGARGAEEAGRLAISKVMVEDPMLRLVRNLQRTIAEDTVRNEYLLRAQVHQWFIAGNESVHDVDRMNEAVYEKLFLTPSSDPWLGLVPADTFSALQNGGVR